MQNATTKKLKSKVPESIIFIVLWLGVFLIPVFTNRLLGVVLWDKIIISWIRICAFLIIFIINIYFLIPLFLYKKQYVRYILSTIVIIPVILCISLQVESRYKKNDITAMPPMEIGPGLPPMEFSKNMPPPVGYRLKQKNILPSADLQFLQSFAIALLVIGTGTAYKVVRLWIREEKERKLLQESLQSGNMDVNDYIFVKADYKMVKIKTSDIMYIESANEYIKIYIEKGEVITTFMRLKNIESTLPAGKFMRVQRSFIINLDKIIAVEKNRIFIEHKKSIPIGEQYKESFQQYLGKNFIK
ncbi:MAG: LytTR family DNA-binding domain-containing protein [Paludibacter sp.]|nr:LytTR family DNA-binding domain-containing protein [Paludibacter sp.]